MEVDNKEDTKEWMRKTKYKNSCLSPEPHKVMSATENLKLLQYQPQHLNHLGIHKFLNTTN